MALQLIIGNKKYSSWSLRAWVFMQQNQIEFDEVHISLKAVIEQQDKTLLREYLSDDKVPVLVDNGNKIWDSLAILEYLSENYLNNSGYPANKEAKALARSISCEMHSSFMAIRSEIPMNCAKKFNKIVLSAQAQVELARVQQLWQLCRDKYSQDGPWLFGAYSIADAMFAPIALRFYGYNISLSTNSENYVNQVINQPCIEKWIKQGQLEQEIIQEDEIDVVGNIKVEIWKS
ncbi:Glutathione S-transferase (EC 2.5.1.18) [uncultured Gammaproteobacteria bacterium]|uniref:glutathione S-transferase n=1 Tax=Bathymodiolus heckerae thiotrophic gill symbiont TaxID=1052212 RepID=UPI0010B857B4|nr:glutathione S-transferase [Bathymodiolus heckerae thiotrophic gill symbiont]CAC9590226.1 Glutathione S-transferase (EC 2.5.1.18) [uncultured Gammaproteobacteria bacterium]SHN90990.1 Glutathione S-transferase [Bathymodiolus heckerae thiotrophic gill symbiont]